MDYGICELACGWWCYWCDESESAIDEIAFIIGAGVGAFVATDVFDDAFIYFGALPLDCCVAPSFAWLNVYLLFEKSFMFHLCIWELSTDWFFSLPFPFLFPVYLPTSPYRSWPSSSSLLLPLTVAPTSPFPILLAFPSNLVVTHELKSLGSLLDVLF